MNLKDKQNLKNYLYQVRIYILYWQGKRYYKNNRDDIDMPKRYITEYEEVLPENFHYIGKYFREKFKSTLTSEYLDIMLLIIEKLLKYE